MSKAIWRRRCPECGDWFGFYVPRGGDGSGVRLRAHNRLRRNGQQWVNERCPGRLEVVDTGEEPVFSNCIEGVPDGGDS